jgi:hypothetical protein
MSREGLDLIKRLKHGNLYVKREMGSILLVYPWICICQERVGIQIAGLTMEMYMPREGCDPYNWLNHEDVYVKSQEKNVIPLTAFTMDIDMSREGWHPISWL